MKNGNLTSMRLFGISAFVAAVLVAPHTVSAHCDTVDGPVVQDARKAIEARDITPVLKWVKPKDEKAVLTAFKKALAGTAKSPEAAGNTFFATLVKIHQFFKKSTKEKLTLIYWSLLLSGCQNWPRLPKF